MGKVEGERHREKNKINKNQSSKKNGQLERHIRRYVKAMEHCKENEVLLDIFYIVLVVIIANGKKANKAIYRHTKNKHLSKNQSYQCALNQIPKISNCIFPLHDIIKFEENNRIAVFKSNNNNKKSPTDMVKTATKIGDDSFRNLSFI